MRLRTVLAASLGAGILVLATPGIATAATGGFEYRYLDANGEPQIGFLIDPPSRDCVTLPEVADPATTGPAVAPLNYTDATAVVFTGPDCTGDYFSLQPYIGHASERLRLRSVLFS